MPETVHDSTVTDAENTEYQPNDHTMGTSEHSSEEVNQSVTDAPAQSAESASQAEAAVPEPSPNKKRLMLLARRELLKRKLVDGYKESKSDAASLDKQDFEHTKSLAVTEGLNKAGKYTGIAGTVGTTVGSFGMTALSKGAYGLGKVQDLFGKENAAKKSADFSENIMKNQTVDDAFSWTGVAGAGLGLVGSGLKTGSSIYSAFRNKNRHKRKTAGYRALSGASAFVTSMNKGLSFGGDLGLFGGRAKDKGSSAQKKSGIIDFFTGVSDLGDKAFDYLGNKSEKEGHKLTAQDSAEYVKNNARSAVNNLSNARDVIEQYKGAKMADISEEERDQLGLARRVRHTAKAQKYAMAQAAALHKTRSEESTKGLFGLIGSSVGLVGSVLKGVSKLLGNTGGVLGTIASVVGAISGGLAGVEVAHGMIKEKKEKAVFAQDKKVIVKSYLKEKIAKIKQQAHDMSLTDREEEELGDEGKTISDEEAECIAIMRLGVNMPESQNMVMDKDYEEAFAKLSEKRANNIMQSSEKEKGEMLNALGLDPDARFEDVLSALKAD